MGMSTFSYSILLFASFVLIISHVIATIGTFTSSSYFGGESLSPHKAYAHMPIGYRIGYIQIIKLVSSSLMNLKSPLLMLSPSLNSASKTQQPANISPIQKMLWHE